MKTRNRENLADEQKAEILRRRDLAVAHPDLLEPWDGTIDRVRAKLHERRRHPRWLESRWKHYSK
jgi:hypothetical protein